MEKIICALIISFYIYGFAGWIWESFICPIITGHRIKNSGFLNGPIVPIYGVGAIVVSLLFYSSETYYSVFINGAFVACVIEYVTSWVMEKLYHRRWWDYSDKAFHVNGRVCLEGFLVFGLFSVVAVKLIQPALMNWLVRYDLIPLVIVSTALTTILTIDLIFTVIALAHLDEKLNEFIKDIEENTQKAFEEFEDNKQTMLDILEKIKESDQQTYQKIYQRRKFNERRILKAFPHLTKRRDYEKTNRK